MDKVHKPSPSETIILYSSSLNTTLHSLHSLNVLEIRGTTGETKVLEPFHPSMTSMTFQSKITQSQLKSNLGRGTMDKQMSFLAPSVYLRPQNSSALELWATVRWHVRWDEPQPQILHEGIRRQFWLEDFSSLHEETHNGIAKCQHWDLLPPYPRSTPLPWRRKQASLKRQSISDCKAWPCTEQLTTCKIWGLHGGNYEECRLLGYKNLVRTSQEKHYVSFTEPSRLMLCKIWGYHGCHYEECLLGY
jgi:hypothetical protein